MRKIQLKVDPRLISKLPEMFGGNEQALRELLQNTYRAGAKIVRVEWRPADKYLTITDDGAGEADPRNVFYPGRTGWEKKSIRNPAGLGLYSLLTEETEAIEFATKPVKGKGWTATLNKADLERRCIEIKESTHAAPGTQICIHYRKNPWPDIKGALQKARGLYPFQLVLSENGEEENIPSCKMPGDTDSSRTFQTQVGEVVLKNDGWRNETCEAVWECQIIEFKALREALDNAVKKHPEEDIAGSLFTTSSYGVRWLINPDCNVRPRLPDRSEIIEGLALECAAYQIVAAVVEEVIEWAQEWKKKWPESITIGKIQPQQMADGWARRDLVCELMMREGWKVVQWPTNEDIDIDCDEDGQVQFWSTRKEALVRNPIQVGSRDLANAINRTAEGKIYAETVDPVARPALTSAKFEELKLVPGCRIGLAKRIFVEGVGDLPYLANEEGEDWEGIPELEGNEAQLVFAGTAEEFLASLDRDILLLIAMISQEQGKRDGSLFDRIDDQIRFDEEKMKEILVGEITRAYQKGKSTECEKYYKLEKSIFLGEVIAASLQDLDNKTGSIENADEYGRKIRDMQKGLQDILVRMKKEKELTVNATGMKDILTGRSE